MAGFELSTLGRFCPSTEVLIGFETEDDRFDYRLENGPRFLARVEKARASLRAGRGVRLEEL